MIYDFTRLFVQFFISIRVSKFSSQFLPFLIRLIFYFDFHFFFLLLFFLPQKNFTRFYIEHMSALLQKIKATNRWDVRANIKLQTNVPDHEDISTLALSHVLRKCSMRAERINKKFEQQILTGRRWNWIIVASAERWEWINERQHNIQHISHSTLTAIFLFCYQIETFLFN